MKRFAILLSLLLAPSIADAQWRFVNGTLRPVYNGNPVTLGSHSTADALRILEPSASGSNYTAFKAQAQAGNIVLTLPSDYASVNGQVLASTTAGDLSWATVESGITIDTTAITGGGANRILFESATNKVTSSANLNWDGTSLNVPSPAKIVTSSINAPIVRTSYINTSNDNYTAMYLDDANGRVGVNKSVPGAQLHTVAGSATTIGAIIQGAAAQTANLTEWQNSAGTVLSSMGVSGTTSILTVGGSRYSGLDTAGRINFAAEGTVFGAIDSYITLGGASGTAEMRFFTKVAGTLVTGFSVGGAGKATFGDATGTSAAVLTSSNYSYGGVSSPFKAANQANYLDGTAYEYVGALSTGTIASTGKLTVLKTAVDSISATTDFTIQLLNNSATLSEIARFTGAGNLQLGANSATPTARSLLGQSGLGTDIAGAALNIAAGKSTGAGAPGVLNIQTAPAGTTGSSLNALVTAAQFDATTVSGDTRMFVYDVDNATLERVTVGIADSGGVGFKLLRIPN